jgi:hypothetical protein
LRSKKLQRHARTSGGPTRQPIRLTELPKRLTSPLAAEAPRRLNPPLPRPRRRLLPLLLLQPQPQTSTGQKTAKTCAEEWRANKAANQTNGVTEKAYVAGCRGGAAPSQIGTAPAGSPTSSPAPSAAAPQADTGQKTAKACAEEWRANKAANQANGVTEKAYVATCRSGPTPPQTTAAPATAPNAAPAPTTTAAPTAKPASSPASNARPAPTNSGNPTGANEFSTEAQAKARCPGDTVVWVNLTSKIYHFSGTRNYGTTEHGAYMCEGDTAAAGMRAAKNEKHP